MIHNLIDFKDTSAVNRLASYVQARHIALRLLDVLNDYYEGTGVEIHDETDLPEMLTSEIQTCLNDLD